MKLQGRASGARRRVPPWVLVAATAIATVVAVGAVARRVDGGALLATAAAAGRDPLGVAVALGAFGAAFVIRAIVWSRVVAGLSVGQALSAIHVALAGNHVLPFRLGEALRVASVVRRARIDVAVAAASTLTLRSADLATCGALVLVGGTGVAGRLVGHGGWLAPAALVACAAAGWVWMGRLGRRGALRRPGPLVVVGSLVAWLLEAVVVVAAARWAGLEAGYRDALVVVGASVAAQAGAVTPGGFGTYEAAAAGAWALLGFDGSRALTAALAAHALKTAYSLALGAVALVWPAPGLLGRLRVPRRPAGPGTCSGPPAPSAGPVVLFLPARNEAPRVNQVLARVPPQVCGRPVVTMVVDDGSSDRTGEVAAAAGAMVVRLDPGRGLGAAVRRGLAEAVAMGAAVVAFCDADGEYAPEELERLVAPILAGAADYVVGSRFAGSITHMRPQRRLGNRLLTWAVRFSARVPVTDGQSGYRALSARAAAAAEILHDYNYAQVLTLDLVAKGFGYQEVPISYGFRRSGQSFVRPVRYLRAVLPAVYRELNTAS